MGSQICKGSAVDIEVDTLFPVQSKASIKLDWSDDLVMHYQCAENCRHNDALGRALKNHVDQRKKRESRQRLKFADNVDEIFIVEDLNTDVYQPQT